MRRRLRFASARKMVSWSTASPSKMVVVHLAKCRSIMAVYHESHSNSSTCEPRRDSGIVPLAGAARTQDASCARECDGVRAWGCLVDTETRTIAAYGIL